ncbi:hypothetical protein ACER0C_002674 [Sarotherodon galilaeus]
MEGLSRAPLADHTLMTRGAGLTGIMAERNQDQQTINLETSDGGQRSEAPNELQHALALVVEVNEGEDYVLLPCQYSSIIPETNPTVTWTRNDLDLKSIHLRREGGDDLTGQNQRYSRRTSMRSDALDTGDFSLTLRKPEVYDSGNYTCTLSYGSHGVERRLTDIELEVKERSWAKVLVVLLVLLVLLVVSGGLLYYFRQYFMPVYEVKVDSGVKSVQLPCKAIVHIPKDAKVEWKDMKVRLVHVYENINVDQSDQPEEQHQFYKGRTEMKRKLLKFGDFSLTLKDPKGRDTKTYTCTVYSKEGNILIEKKVLLQVKVCQVEVEEGVESVQLPCKTTGNLPKDVVVVWRGSEDRKVHVYENGSDQLEEQDQDYRGRTEMNEDLLRTGDLSLTLKQPTERDSGVYKCMVNSSSIIQYKIIPLKVKGICLSLESTLTPPVCVTALHSHCWEPEQEPEISLK